MTVSPGPDLGADDEAELDEMRINENEKEGWKGRNGNTKPNDEHPSASL